MCLADRVHCLMERLLVRGVPYRLLLVPSIVVGGGCAWVCHRRVRLARGGRLVGFLAPQYAPSYLGDEEGAALRTIATVVMLFGWVLFVGVLVAVMTQWLSEAICDLLDEARLTGDDAHTVLLELTDEDNAVLYDDDPAEGILNPLMVSQMLAHVALRRELLPVYETLFQAGGPQLRFPWAARDSLTERPVGIERPIGVNAQRHTAAQRGETFLGVRFHPPRSFSATLTPDDDLLVDDLLVLVKE